MFDLNTAIDQWLDDAVAAQPNLEQYRDEIADHLATASQSGMTDGQEPAEAFAAATDAIGSPADLATEFRKDGASIAWVRRLIEPDRVPTRRDHLTVSILWVVMSLFWAGVMLVVDNSVTWATFAWLLTTYLPLGLLNNAMAKQQRTCASR